jgi:hypothetical protein
VDGLLLALLFIHIGSAIAGFGPTFAFSFLGAMGGQEPQHANFALRVGHRINDRLVEPLAIVVGLSGVGLIWRSGRDPFRETWLLVAIVLYVIALSFALLVQRRTVLALIEATSGPPPELPPGSPPPSGPPPHIAALVKRSQMGGMLLAVLLVTIVALMVFKPTL